MSKLQRQERRIRTARARSRRADSAYGIGFSLPYDRRNWMVLGIGLLVIAIGYWFLAQPPVDGPMSLTVAPILLVLGYVVIVPAGLLLGKKAEKGEGASPAVKDAGGDAAQAPAGRP